MGVARWIVFALAALWALVTNYEVRASYKGNSQPHLPANMFALFQLGSVFYVLFLHFSFFHLLWLFPASYVSGFLSLRIRILGRVAWAYGYLLAITIPSNW